MLVKRQLIAGIVWLDTLRVFSQCRWNNSVASPHYLAVFFLLYIVFSILRTRKLISQRLMVFRLLFGFVERKFCFTNLLLTFEEWTSTLDQGFGIDLVLYASKKDFTNSLFI